MVCKTVLYIKEGGQFSIISPIHFFNNRSSSNRYLMQIHVDNGHVNSLKKNYQKSENERMQQTQMMTKNTKIPPKTTNIFSNHKHNNGKIVLSLF